MDKTLDRNDGIPFQYLGSNGQNTGQYVDRQTASTGQKRKVRKISLATYRERQRARTINGSNSSGIESSIALERQSKRKLTEGTLQLPPQKRQEIVATVSTRPSWILERFHGAYVSFVNGEESLVNEVPSIPGVMISNPPCHTPLSMAASSSLFEDNSLKARRTVLDVIQELKRVSENQNADSLRNPFALKDRRIDRNLYYDFTKKEWLKCIPSETDNNRTSLQSTKKATASFIPSRDRTAHAQQEVDIPLRNSMFPSRKRPRQEDVQIAEMFANHFYLPAYKLQKSETSLRIGDTNE